MVAGTGSSPVGRSGHRSGAIPEPFDRGVCGYHPRLGIWMPKRRDTHDSFHSFNRSFYPRRRSFYSPLNRPSEAAAAVKSF